VFVLQIFVSNVVFPSNRSVAYATIHGQLEEQAKWHEKMVKLDSHAVHRLTT